MRSIALACLVLSAVITACNSDDSAGGAAEPFTPAAKAKTGAVNLFVGDSPTSSPGSGQKAFSIAGYFLDYSGAPPETVPGGYSYSGVRATECTRRTAGNCELVKCKLTTDPSFQQAQARYTAAGEITAKLSTGPELKSTASAATSDAYLGEVPLTDVPPPGTTVTVTASGGDVPAFSETLTFSERLALKSTAPVSVARGTDVTIEWTSGQGTVSVSGSAGNMDSVDTVALSCTFPSSGSGTIPGALLGDELAGKKISLSAYLTHATKTIGDYEVMLNAVVNNDGLGAGNFDLEVK